MHEYENRSTTACKETTMNQSINFANALIKKRQVLNPSCQKFFIEKDSESSLIDYLKQQKSHASIRHENDVFEKRCYLSKSSRYLLRNFDIQRKVNRVPIGRTQRLIKNTIIGLKVIPSIRTNSKFIIFLGKIQLKHSKSSYNCHESTRK